MTSNFLYLQIPFQSTLLTNFIGFKSLTTIRTRGLWKNYLICHTSKEVKHKRRKGTPSHLTQVIISEFDGQIFLFLLVMCLNELRKWSQRKGKSLWWQFTRLGMGELRLWAMISLFNSLKSCHLTSVEHGSPTPCLSLPGAKAQFRNSVKLNILWQSL